MAEKEFVLSEKLFIKLLKEEFCTGKEYDTTIKEFCSKGDHFYCENCEKIDKLAGGLSG